MLDFYMYLRTYFIFYIYSAGNEQLARSGSNCLENLIVSTGKQFFPDMWDRVCDCISDIFTASLPTELLTWKPPERLYRTQSNASLGSSVSSLISESPLPPMGRPISVASVESSAIDPQTPAAEDTEVTTKEAPAAPEIAIIPSSPPTSEEGKNNQTAGTVDNTTSTVTPINAQDDSKTNVPDNTIANVPGDSLTSGVANDKAAVTGSTQKHEHVKQPVQGTVTEETVENAPLLHEDTDYPVSHGTPHGTPQHRVPAASGKPPSSKQAQQKEKKQKATGSFLQRKKRGSASSGAGKKKNTITASAVEAGSRKDILKKHNHKLSHLQSPDADLAKSKFNKIGMMIVCL